MDIKVNLDAIKKASEDLSNWSRWGKDDQIGTLNLVTPDDIIEASKLIKKGKVFSLGIPLDREGPQKWFIWWTLQSYSPNACNRNGCGLWETRLE